MRVIIGTLTLLIALSSAADTVRVESLPALQKPVTNNATTLVATRQGDYLYSFLGLGSGKTWRDTRLAATVLNPGENSWTMLEPAPGLSGRLAATAVSADGAAWLFGGYTVAADGSEKSIPGVYRVHPGESKLKWVTDMPVAVEDAVILVFMDRYIYLVSGWHDLGNVNLVQMLDTKTMSWTQATPWPGKPVFGHSGGISENRILVCDGVMIRYPVNAASREFLPSSECWSGSIDENNSRRIQWQPIPSHPGAARYRMAATGDLNQRVVFAGGTANPYNFDGIGYNGVPAEPENSVFSYSFKTGSWHLHGGLEVGTMDHRGLAFSNGWYYLVGGMQGQQRVVADVYRFRLE